jgi:branched-chain amino acid transport system ATP-binding protein
MLEIEDIYTYYGDSNVLQGVSLKVEKGTVAALLGRNGVGKTTLIRSIIGFTPPRKGKILFNGVEITHKPSYEIMRMGIGLIPQGRRIFPSLSVRENLEITMRYRTKKTAESWTLEKVLGLFPSLRERLRHQGNQLSGGEQQMLASGRALMGTPLCLLMDEPTEGLAPVIVQELGHLIEQIKQHGLPILLVEQSLAFALKHADNVYIMSKGRIVYQSSPQALRGNQEIQSRYLGV